MDCLDNYRRIIQQVLRPYSNLQYAYDDIHNSTVFDPEADRYLIVSSGWGQDRRRIHGCLIHVEIVGGKVWIQRDGTEDGIADELMAAGIPKEHIVLGFKSPEVRQYTGFAVN